MNKAQAIKSHLYDLSKVFGKYISFHDFSRLKEIEKEGHAMAEAYCNGTIDSDEYDKEERRMMREIGTLTLASDGIIHLNGDPRGYFLKINNEWIRENCRDFGHKDWGGYGIVCPEELN